MLQEISYYPVLGRPLFIYPGIIALCGFILTAIVPIMNKHRIRLIPFAWHSRLAFFSLACALIHATLGVLLFL